MRRLALICLAIVAGLFAFQWWRGKEAPATAPGERIVSLAPNLTEILFELGAGDQVVGVTNYCFYPPEVSQRQRIGDFVNPNFELILQLRPTMIVAESWSSSRTVPRLRQLGLNVLEVPTPASFEEIFALYDRLGRACGQFPAAQRLQSEMKQSLDAISQRAASLPATPTVYVEIDLPTWTVGRPSFIDQAVKICGGRNLFTDVERPAIEVSTEEIIRRNPDVIVSLEAKAPQFRTRPGWERIAAVRNGRIIDDIDRNLLSHGNHRLIDGMEQLQERLLKLFRP